MVKILTGINFIMAKNTFTYFIYLLKEIESIRTNVLIIDLILQKQGMSLFVQILLLFQCDFRCLVKDNWFLIGEIFLLKCWLFSSMFLLYIYVKVCILHIIFIIKDKKKSLCLKHTLFVIMFETQVIMFETQFILNIS